MKTPICDFVNKYSNDNKIRLHMPGHKGKSFLGLEHLDITEVDGADSLYEANGIIAQSERNASELFGCRTYYSTEGSSQCIKAMLHLLSLDAKSKGQTPYIWAGRNAHKAFHSAIALLDVDVDWIFAEDAQSYLSYFIDVNELTKAIKQAKRKPTAIYLTSPDYLGYIADIESIAKVCHENGILLAVDNAHGAYLRFLEKSLHPIDLGADICCDSAHKTLPVLTGGAYLHLNDVLSEKFDNECVKDALLLFGSTSPSYLILQSLDMANKYLEAYQSELACFIKKAEDVMLELSNHGYELYGSEPLKITINTKAYGYIGEQFKDIMLENGVVCEFTDRDFVVMMLTPEISKKDLNKLLSVLLSIPKKEVIREKSPQFSKLERRLSIREAMLSNSEHIPVNESVGRVVAMPSVGCPPAVPIAVAGEIIDENALDCFAYYGINNINVIK